MTGHLHECECGWTQPLPAAASGITLKVPNLETINEGFICSCGWPDLAGMHTIHGCSLDGG